MYDIFAGMSGTFYAIIIYAPNQTLLKETEIDMYVDINFFVKGKLVEI